MIRDYPAYGRTIAAHVTRGQKPICVGVLLSSRWEYFDHVPKVCIKPADWRPGRYDFDFLRGLHVVVVPGDGTADEQLGELVIELMGAGPKMLWAFGADGTPLYDADPCFAFDLRHWAFNLCGKSIDWRSLRDGPERVMRDAQAREARRWLEEFQLIERRKGLDAAFAYHVEDERNKKRVRDLFATPFPEERAPQLA